MRNLVWPEELGEQGLPLAGGQLDIWLAQQTGRSDTEWQHSQFVVIEGTVKPDLLERAILQVVREPEPIRAAFFGSLQDLVTCELEYESSRDVCQFL